MAECNASSSSLNVSTGTGNDDCMGDRGMGDDAAEIQLARVPA